MAKEIWVFIEQFEGKALDISWELLGKSREMADKSKQKLVGYVFGHNIKHIAEEAIHRGADQVYTCDEELMAQYRCETYARVAYDLLTRNKGSVNILILGATPNGRDLAGRLAVKLKTGLTADVVSMDVDGELLLGQVPGFGGSIMAIIKCETARPQMATVRPGIFDAKPVDKSRKGKIKSVESGLTHDDITTQIIKTHRLEGVDISKAKRLVAGGRGLGGDLSHLKKLAELLDAQIGVTRPLCDDGLLPRDHQVGSTGVTVKPDITINFGISGAAHYTAGINESTTIISINNDPEATIFEFTDYGVVGDVHEIMPLLIDKLKMKLEEKMEVAK